MLDGFVTEDFISEIERHPAIWNVGHDDYNAKAEKKAAWEDVVAKFVRNYDDMEASEKQNTLLHLQRKWKSLRDSFSRELQKKKKQKSTEVRKQYVYFPNLCFLQSVMKPSATNFTDVPVEDEVGQEVDVKILRPPPPPPPCQSQETKEPPDVSKKRPNKRKEAEEDELFAMLRDKVMNQKQDDDDKLFMLSLVPELKRIPESEKLNIKIELMNVFKRAKLRLADPLVDQEGCFGTVGHHEVPSEDEIQPWDT